MQTEHVILLGAQGVPTGTLEKYATHTADTRLHLVFSSRLSNAKGQLLVTRHVLSKKAWPGVQTNSVCGHLQLGESNGDAVIHRCRYELGVEITPPEFIYPNPRYRAIGPGDTVKNEVYPAFAARITNALQINDDEVMDHQWCDLADVLHGIDTTPWAFSPRMVMQTTNREARKRLSVFTRLKQENPDICRGCEHDVILILPDASSGAE